MCVRCAQLSCQLLETHTGSIRWHKPKPTSAQPDPTKRVTNAKAWTDPHTVVLRSDKCSLHGQSWSGYTDVGRKRSCTLTPSKQNSFPVLKRHFTQESLIWWFETKEQINGDACHLRRQHGQLHKCLKMGYIFPGQGRGGLLFSGSGWACFPRPFFSFWSQFVCQKGNMKSISFTGSYLFGFGHTLGSAGGLHIHKNSLCDAWSINWVV